jgi:hypothetical protein
VDGEIERHLTTCMASYNVKWHCCRPRAFETLVEFVKKAAEPVVKEVSSLKEFQTIKEQEPVFFILLAASKQEKTQELWEESYGTMARSYRIDTPFYKATSPEVEAAVRAALPAKAHKYDLLVVKEGEVVPYVFDGFHSQTPAPVPVHVLVGKATP